MSTIYSSFIQQSYKFICYLNKYNKFWENEQNLLLNLWVPELTTQNFVGSQEPTEPTPTEPLMPFSLSSFFPHPLSFFFRDIHIFEYLTIFQVLVKRPGHKTRSKGQVTRPDHKAWSQCQVAKLGCNVKNKYTHFLLALSLTFLYTFLNH
jgi:hypothetical protein